MDKQKSVYHIYPKYWETITSYYISPKIWLPVSTLEVHLKIADELTSDEQCRPWSDATFCGIWSGSRLFGQQAYLSHYLIPLFGQACLPQYLI